MITRNRLNISLAIAATLFACTKEESSETVDTSQTLVVPVEAAKDPSAVATGPSDSPSTVDDEGLIGIPAPEESEPSPPPPPPELQLQWTSSFGTITTERDVPVALSLVAEANIPGELHYDLDTETSSCLTSPWASPLGLDGSEIRGTPSVADLGICTITATASQGDKTISGLFVINVLDSTLTAPDAITSLALASRRTDAIEVAWTAPAPGSSAILGYTIEYKKTASAEWTSLGNQVFSDTLALIPGLDSETEYQFKIRAFNGAYSADSNILVATTLIDDTFFASDLYQAMNVGGATESQVVAFEDGTEVKLNGELIATLNGGETHGFASAELDVLEANKPIYAAGKLAIGTAVGTIGNIVWSTPDWAGTKFIFNTDRLAPNIVKIYAFQDATIGLFEGETQVDTVTISKGAGHTFSIATYSSFRLESSGLIMAYTYASNNGTFIADPRPILPMSRDIIGYASSAMRVTSLADGTVFTATHSNDANTTVTLDSGVSHKINSQGNRKNYRGEALRITADNFVIGFSYADSNGYCAAPFLPVSMMRKRFAINVDSNWLAMASIEPVTVTVTLPDGSESSHALARTGSNAAAPYKLRLTGLPAGTRISGDQRMAAWYEPSSNTNGGLEDETILHGVD